MHGTRKESEPVVALAKLTPAAKRTAVVAAAVIVPAILFLLWTAGASVFQFFAVPILFATFAISIWMAAHWREWRALPISLVAGMVIARQILDLCVTGGFLSLSTPVELLSEITVWISVPLAFASIAYLWRIFENQARFRHAQNALQESERQYRHLIENSTDAVYTADADGNLTLANSGAAKLFGRRSGDLIGMNIFDLLPPTTRKDIENAMSRQLNDNISAFYHEFPVTHRNGKHMWVGQNIQAVVERGNLHGLQGVLRDITERREAEEALRKSENRLRTIVDTMSEGIIQSGPNGRIVFANSAAESLLGVQRTQLETHNESDSRWEFLRPDGSPMPMREWPGHRAREEKRPVQNVAGIKRSDGRISWLSANAVPVLNGDDVDGVVITFTDISKAREAEENIRIVEFAIDNAGEHVFLVSRDGPIIYSNRRAQESLGWTAEEILARTIHDIDPDVSPEDWAETWRLAKAGEWPSFESAHITKDGNSFPTMTSCNYFEFDGQGYIFAFVHDISRQTELASQLRQSQKMEAIGTLAGGIAHDFNNILSAVLGYAELALNDVDKESNVHMCLTEVHKAGERATDLVKQILTFSRRKEQKRQPLRLGPIVKEALKLLRSSLPATIEIRRSVNVDTSPVMADAGQLHQVIMNLCTNAYQAMTEKGGILEVSLNDTDITASDTVGHLNLSPGKYVKLSVNDTGTGIDEETRQRMFEPFFTTKPEGEGTGLGLATVHGIAKDHKGSIRVDSRPGEGTRIDVLIPVCQRSAEDAKRNDRTEEPQNGDERILFVEDEEQISGCVSIGLGRLGYTVCACSSGLEAIEQFRSDPEAFDIVVTDQTMSGMTGLELAAQLHVSRPDLPIVLYTGQKNGLNHDKAREMGVRQILSKPVGIYELGKAVRTVLDKATATA